MSTEPAPSATRGDVTLQPAYFTSSLFVNPLREDIARLVQEYAQKYLQYSENNAAADQGVEATTSSPSRQEGGPGPETTDSQTENTENHDIASTAYTSVPSMEGSALPNKSALGPVHPKPFALFKQLWSSQGWCWFHLKALDGRARESCINVVFRLFLEYFSEQVNSLAQVIALFGLYTFYTTQPKTSSLSEPLPGPFLFCVKHIAIPYDAYNYLLGLPARLTEPQLSRLLPHVTYLLSTLLKRDAFHIYPHSSLKTQYTLPREWFVDDTESMAVDTPDGQQNQEIKKKGRPGKGDRSKKRKDALTQLDKWLDRSTYTYPDPPEASEPSSSGIGPSFAGTSGALSGRRTTHTLISHPPNASLAIYQLQKQEYLNAVDARVMPNEVCGLYQEFGGAAAMQPNPERLKEKEAIGRANEAMLTRLKKIDEMAAEKGLEVGAEGGEMTGLERVEKAVKEMRGGVGSGRQGGILNLVEGAGMDPPATQDGNMV